MQRKYTSIPTVYEYQSSTSSHPVDIKHQPDTVLVDV